MGEAHLDKDNLLVIQVDGKDRIVEENGGIVNLASGYNGFGFCDTRNLVSGYRST